MLPTDFRLWFVLALFVAIVAFASFGGESRFRWKQHRWKHRLLLVFGSSPTSADFLRQRAICEKAESAMNERHLLLVPVVSGERERVLHEFIDTEAAAALRKDFGVEAGAFTVLLVGKDGSEKLRRNRPVAMDEIFGLIDSMPMRRQEMRERPAH